MNARPRFVDDAAKHLADELVAVLGRHSKLVVAGGGSPIELSAALIDSTETYVKAAFGIVVLLIDQSQRQKAYRDIVGELTARLRNDEAVILGAIDASWKRAEAAI